jgi:hypothetical protein
VKDRLASVEIAGANMSTQHFNNDVGTISSGEDLAGILAINLDTSRAVVGSSNVK